MVYQMAPSQPIDLTTPPDWYIYVVWKERDLGKEVSCLLFHSILNSYDCVSQDNA